MINSRLILLLVPLLLVAFCSAAPYESAPSDVHANVNLDIGSTLQRIWSGISCLGTCRSSWGFSGHHFGSDPWGGVLRAGDPLPYSGSSSNDQSNSPVSSSSSTEPLTSATDDGFNIQDITLSADLILPTSTVSLSVDNVPTLIPTTSSSTTIIPTPTAAPVTTPSQDPAPTPDPQPETSTQQQQPPPTTEQPAPAPTTNTPDASPDQVTQSPSNTPDNSNSVQSSTSSSDEEQYLQQHNTVRAQHGANPVTWSDQLAGFAQEWANNCQFLHSGGRFGELGENIAAGTGVYTIPEMVGDWVAEVSEYDPSNPQPSHYTQVVWKSTTQIGCAKATCDGIIPNTGIGTFYVCEYSPAGNVIGQFSENVQA